MATAAAQMLLFGKELQDEGRPSEAEQMYLRALAETSNESFVATEGLRREGIMSLIHMALAECVLTQNNPQVAWEHSRKSIVLAADAQKPALCITLGNCWMVKGYPKEARDLFEEALLAASAPDVQVEALIGVALALCAMSLFQDARLRIEEIDRLTTLGLQVPPEVLDRINYLKQLYSYRARSTSLPVGVPSGDEERLTVRQLNLQGMQYRREHRFTQSEEVLRRALRLSVERNESADIQGSVLGNLSQTLQCQAQKLGREEGAKPKWLEAIDLARRAAGAMYDSGSANVSIGLALMGLSSVVGPEEMSVHLEAAAVHLQEAITDFGRLQSNLRADMQARIRSFEAQKGAYVELSRCLFWLNRPWEALVVAERARTRVLMFQLRRSRLDKRPLADADFEHFDNSATYAWEQIERARQACGRDAVLVEYALSEGELFIWAVTNTRAYFRHVSTAAIQLGNSLYLDILAELVKRYAKKRWSKERGDAILERLNSILIQPIADILDRMDPLQPLVIISPEFLGFVPFAALRCTAFPGREYLIQRHTVAVAPSARALLQSAQLLEEKTQLQLSRPTQALIVGNPIPMALGEPQLKHAQEEAEEVGDLFRKARYNTEVLVGTAASIGAVTRGLEGAAIALLATHGLVSKEYLQGAILLAEPGKSPVPTNVDGTEASNRLAGWPEEDLDLPSDEPWSGYQPEVDSPADASLSEVLASLPTGGTFDQQPGTPWPGVEEHGLASLADHFQNEVNLGVLSSQHLAHIRLSAHIVVLSACKTGLGEVTSEGVLGLGRALLLGGVPTAVLSLWAVPDKSTQVFMGKLFKALLAGEDTAHALRSSMLAMISEKTWLPHSWAPFFCFGLPTTKVPRMVSPQSSSQQCSVVKWLGILTCALATSLVMLKVKGSRV